MTREEIVVYHCHECNGKCENTFAAVVDVLLHSDEHKRKESSYVLKMIEEKVEYLKSRESIRKSACERRVLAAYKSSDICVGCQRSNSVLECKEHGH